MPGAIEIEQAAYKMVRIFLSAVSGEFRSYRNQLSEKLKRPNVAVHTQEDFVAFGAEMLQKLDDYIRECDLIVHLVGDMTGAIAEDTAVKSLAKRYPDLVTR